MFREPTAFRWAADQGDRDSDAIIATYPAFLGMQVDLPSAVSATSRRCRDALGRRWTDLQSVFLGVCQRWYASVPVPKQQ